MIALPWWLAALLGVALALLWPAGRGRRRLQTTRHGVGPLVHRRYFIDVVGAQADPAAVLAELRDRFAEHVPSRAASFKKSRGRPERTRAGDEFGVLMTGARPAAVRVVEARPHTFRLASLEGHPEAGDIRFSVAPRGPDQFRFEIESHARSDAPSSRLLYKLGGSRVQQRVWASVCREVLRLSGGRAPGGVQVQTQEEEA